MDDLRVGAAFRAVRVRRRWRQSDVAARAGVSRAFVSLLERGHLDRVSLATLRQVARTLDIRVDLYARWRGGSLDRMLNVRHSRLAESVAVLFAALPAWLHRTGGLVLRLRRARGDRHPGLPCRQRLSARHRAEDGDRRHQRACRDAGPQTPSRSRDREGAGLAGEDGEPMGDRQPEQDQPASCRCTPSHAASRIPG